MLKMKSRAARMKLRTASILVFILLLNPRWAFSQLVDSKWFGKLAYDMSLEEVQELGGIYGGRNPIDYSEGNPWMMQIATTFLGEYVTLDVGFGQTSSKAQRNNVSLVHGVGIHFGSCVNPVVKPSGFYLSAECKKVLAEVEKILTNRFGRPTISRQHVGPDKMNDMTKVWKSPTSKITIEILSDVEILFVFEHI